MRKFFNLALATAFICGASVFTACSSDDDNNSKKADEGGQNRKEFVEHTRANLKTMAENLNFGSWEIANAINQNFNEYVLNNPEFERVILPLFAQQAMENIQPVEEGSQLAEMGYEYYAAIDLSKINYRFTMTDDNKSFDVEPADQFEMILNSYNPRTQQVEKGLLKLTLKAGGKIYKRLLSRLSSGETAVLALIPEDVTFALSNKITGSWRDAYTGTFKNASKNSDASKIIVKENAGFSVSGSITSNIPAVQENGRKADETTLKFSIDSDRDNHKGTALVSYEHNGQKMVELSLKESGEAPGLANLDLSQFSSTTSIFDVLGAIWTGRNIDEGKITLLDDLTTTFSISDMSKVMKLNAEMAEARRNYADEATIDGYTQQLDKLIKGSMTCKGVNQTIPMKLMTDKFGVDYTAVVAFKFADEENYVPMTQVLDQKSMEYALNIADHAIDPMKESLITVRQLIQFVNQFIGAQKKDGVAN